MAPVDLSVTSSSLGAFLGGSVIYWLYFHRYETHLYAFTYGNLFLATSSAVGVALNKVYSVSVPVAASLTAIGAASFLIGAFGNCLFYRLFLNPLNKFPGPWPARISNLWLSTQLGNSDGYYWLQEQHKKHGKIVRIGSHDISVIDPEIMEQAYGNKSRVTKAAWYDNDHPLTSMHTTRDKGLHDRRRRVWAPAFSEKALR